MPDSTALPAPEWIIPSAGLLQRTHRVLARCLWAYGLAAGMGAAAACPGGFSGAWAAEWRASGLAGVVTGAALAACAGLAAVTAMNGARLGPGVRGRFGALDGSGRACQAVLAPALAGLAALTVWAWPGAEADPAVATALGAVCALAAFPALLAERFVAALPAAVLPEAPALRRLLGVPVALLLVAGGAEALRGQGLRWPDLVVFGAGLFLMGLGAELAVRGTLRWFQPPAELAQRRAAVASVLADLPGLARAGGAAAPLRAHFGLDFSRSWALAFLRKAAGPALVLTAVFCWLLSGVAVLPGDGRGVYERFGRPVAVLGPGLHVTLPWPLGRVRAVELGVVHAAPLGAELTVGAPVPAEAPPPLEADRLWDQPHPGEADWLIAGTGVGGQSFALMSADIRVLWRVGLPDGDALRALYGVAAPDALVRAAASRTAFAFFAGRTLDSVLDGRQEGMAEAMQADLARALDGSGIEVVAVAIEAVHPPAGAASAYHNVHAAEIAARTSISAEVGRAKGTRSLAREQAWDLVSRARAGAGEMLAAADGDGRRFAGEREGHAAGGGSYTLERYLGTVAAAFARAPLTIVDARVAPGMAPVIDLRPLAAAARAAPEDAD